MKMNVLVSELSRGEAWESRDERLLTVAPSHEHGSDAPTVVFASLNAAMAAVEQLYLSPDDAEKLGKALLVQARMLRREWELMLEGSMEPDNFTEVQEKDL